VIRHVAAKRLGAQPCRQVAAVTVGVRGCQRVIVIDVARSAGRRSVGSLQGPTRRSVVKLSIRPEERVVARRAL